MLLRLYRLTDKFSLIILKSTTVSGSLAAETVSGIVGSPIGQRSGLLGLLAALLGLIFGVLLTLLTFILAAITALGALVRTIFARFFGTAATVTTRAGSAAMARRAARAEMDVVVTEDPLKAQNRILGMLVLVMLVALIGVVIWATNPRDNAVPIAANPNALLAATNPLVPTEPASDAPPIAIATTIPTATALPDVFQSSGSISYTLRENGQNDLWAVNIGSRSPIRITNDIANERDPAWSPVSAGLKLAYASNKSGNWDIYIYDLASNTEERKTFGLNFDGAPSWSPDGNWLVYETYQAGNLDIYVLPVTDENASLAPITTDPAADFSPSWSPDGRNIAFASWRDGNQDIHVVSLDDVSAPINLTNSVTRAEDYPAWHPDGDLIAYSALDEGVEKIFVKSLSNPDATPQLIGGGRQPAWSPDGNAIIATVDSSDATHFTVYPYQENLGTTQIIAAPPRADSPAWTSFPLPPALVNAGGLPLLADNLYIEQETRRADGLYTLGALINGVDAPSPQLSDRVNDSFNALREAVLEKTGRDFLGKLSDAFWQINQRPQLGENPRNWHYTGRAFAIDRNSPLVGFPETVQIVREERGLRTYWRVFVRVAEEAQDGQLGEPLRDMPWDINSRTEGDVEAYENGGRIRAQIPSGYYVDLTELARDYGWQPLPAETDWRLNFNAMNYWAFVKPDGLAWLDAMLELWTTDQLGAFAPTPVPVPTQEPES